MFGDGVPKDSCLGSTKASYYATEALGPFFREEILVEVSGAFYTLHFDETTNVEGWKELQVAIQFWSSKTDEVVFRHLETFFIGKLSVHYSYSLFPNHNSQEVQVKNTTK